LQKKQLVYSYSFIYAVIYLPQMNNTGASALPKCDNEVASALPNFDDEVVSPLPNCDHEVVSPLPNFDDEVASQGYDRVASQHRVSSKTRKPVIQIHASKTLPETSHIQNSTGKRATAAEAKAAEAAAAVAEKVGERWITIKNCGTTVPPVGGRAGARPTKEAEEKARAKERGAGKFE
jgi:hypothetical protein